MNTSTADTVRTDVNDKQTARQMRRSADNRMLGGVAAGIARYLDVDVMLTRIIVAVLAVGTGVGLVCYLAAWLLIPADGTAKSIAETWIADRRSTSL
jgi:phage shock protein PspC (stress-responsive transcriptional regulator)